MAFHYAITKKYGPQPLLMRRAYTTIVIPAFTFGCHVFGDKCLQETIKKSLIRLNRLASLLIAQVAPSTPTKGMEVIYNLMPLDILIEKRASEIMEQATLPYLDLDVPLKVEGGYGINWSMAH